MSEAERFGPLFKSKPGTEPSSTNVVDVGDNFSILK